MTTNAPQNPRRVRIHDFPEKSPSPAPPSANSACQNLANAADALIKELESKKQILQELSDLKSERIHHLRVRIAELEDQNKRLRDLIGYAWESGWKAGRDEEDAKSFEDFLRDNGLGEG